jgi:acetylornithine deacetylase/succinyl-diaminopimelate desuccinylase-like protein
MQTPVHTERSATRNGNHSAGGVTLATIAELAGSQAMRDCLNWFTREKQWINERHVQLCRIPAPTFFEQKRAEWMAEQFRMLGCDAHLDRAGNVICLFNSSYQGPLIAVTAHLDTVLAPRNPTEIGVTPDGSLHGPGVSDNGAGLTALISIAAVLKSCQGIDPSPLLLIANVGEEGEGNLSGMRYICKQSPLASRIHKFLVLDGPNTDHITCQALASRRFEVTVSGPGGHSWSDYGIGNPVHAVSRAITSFSDRTQNDSAGARYSFNFGVIEGGSSINSIPSSARAKVDIRSENASKINELSSLLTSCVEAALEVENERATGGKIAAKIKEIGSRPGGQLPEGAPLLNVVRAVDAHLGIRSRLDCASTDANIPLSLGMPAVSIGAGGQGGGAHTASEWFHPDGREFGLKRVLLIASSLAASLAAASAPVIDER